MSAQSARREAHPPARAEDPLWRKRRQLEAKRERAWWRMAGNAHPRPPVRAVALRMLLRMTGLLPRGLRNAQQIAVRTLTFSFDTLPDAFDGFQILQLADLHLGEDRDFAAIVRDLVNDIHADLCVMTGDYRFHRRGSYDNMFRELDMVLPAVHAPHGTVAILGNHDLSDFAPAFQERGVRLLTNENISIERDDARIWVAGVDDPHQYRCADVASAVRHIPPGDFTLLLAHSPEAAAEAAAHDVALYLCGHTHGGQVCLPGGSIVFKNTRCPRSRARGVWRYGGMIGYTTTGIGTTDIPVRFNCPPEAALIELRCTEHAPL